jgi:hypothetical protein
MDYRDISFKEIKPGSIVYRINEPNNIVKKVRIGFKEYYNGLIFDTEEEAIENLNLLKERKIINHLKIIEDLNDKIALLNKPIEIDNNIDDYFGEYFTFIHPSTKEKITQYFILRFRFRNSTVIYSNEDNDVFFLTHSIFGEGMFHEDINDLDDRIRSTYYTIIDRIEDLNKDRKTEILNQINNPILNKMYKYKKLKQNY